MKVKTKLHLFKYYEIVVVFPEISFTKDLFSKKIRNEMLRNVLQKSFKAQCKNLRLPGPAN